MKMAPPFPLIVSPLLYKFFAVLIDRYFPIFADAIHRDLRAQSIPLFYCMKYSGITGQLLDIRSEFIVSIQENDNASVSD